VEGTVDSLLDIVFEHSEDEIDHEAVLELHHLGGGCGVKGDALKELKEIE
jgi:hypothetical protein